MHVYLKIKIKTLSAEASDIRNQERKLNAGTRARKRMARALELNSLHNGTESRVPMTAAQFNRLEKKLARARARLTNGNTINAFWGLRNHRTYEVRKEARSSFIAYGFLRGRPYSSIEQTDKPVDWERVEALVKKYGVDDIRERMQRFSEWKDAGNIDPNLVDIAAQVMQ